MPMTEGRELPVIQMREFDLPQIREWEIGSEHYVVVKVKLMEKRDNAIRDDMDETDKKRIEGVLKMQSVKVLDHKPVNLKSMAKADFNQAYVEAMTEGK